MEMSVRRATAEDYHAVCELFGEMDAVHRAQLPHLFREPGQAARDQDYYLGLISDENVALLVAEAGGQLAGFVHAGLRDAPALPIFRPRRIAIVDGIAVRAGFQQRGIGRLLMDAAQEWAIAKGAASIELNVYAFNAAAISFYERLGYRTLSRKMSKELKVDGNAG
jgi:ribosomal protein S18 acetylase RimI-like enzyme